VYISYYIHIFFNIISKNVSLTISEFPYHFIEIFKSIQIFRARDFRCDGCLMNFNLENKHKFHTSTTHHFTILRRAIGKRLFDNLKCRGYHHGTTGVYSIYLHRNIFHWSVLKDSLRTGRRDDLEEIRGHAAVFL